MRVHTHHGWTDCTFEDFAAVEPKLVQIREDFLAKKIDKDEVKKRLLPLVGMARFHRDFDAFFAREAVDYGYGKGYPTDAIQRWTNHVEEKKLNKLYYSHEVVAGCITQEAQ